MAILHHTFRTEVAIPGETIYAIFPSGLINTTSQTYTAEGSQPPVMPSGWTFFIPSNYGGASAWHRQWAWGITIPSTYPSGIYNVYFPTSSGTPAPEPPIVVRVLPTPPVRPIKFISKGGRTLGETQRWLQNGYDIELCGRQHIWDFPLLVPSGAKIFSVDGATIVRRVETDTATNYHIFRPSGSMILKGVTLTHDDTILEGGMKFFHPNVGTGSANRNADPITIEDVWVKRGYLGSALNANVLIKNCTFDKGSCATLPQNCVVIGCKFVGPTRPVFHSFLSTSSSGCLFVNNEFERTNRGMIFQTGEVYGCLIADNHFHNIRGGETNANEVILVEIGTNGTLIPSGAVGCRENMFLQNWITDCAGPGISLVGTGTHANWFYENLVHVDSVGIGITAIAGAGWQSHNLFNNHEVFGGLVLNGKVGRVTLSSMQFMERMVLSGNAAKHSAAYVTLNNANPFYTDATALSQGTYVFSDTSYHNLTGIFPITSITFTKPLPPLTQDFG